MPDLPPADPSLRAALHGVRAMLLDLDGVLTLRNQPIPGAVDAMAALEAAGFPYLVATNSSLISRAHLVRWLRKLGFPATVERVHSALSATEALVRREFGERPVYALCSTDARSDLAGLNLVGPAEADAEPWAVAAVVLGDSPDELTKENLDRAFRLARAGAQLIGMHRNPWWITPAGPTLDAGAFLVGLEWALGRRARIAGKPSPAFFAEAVTRLADEAVARGQRAPRKSTIVMVGDDVTLDIGGGRRAGVRTVFVRSGKHGDPELHAAATRARGAYRPDAVAPSIAEVVSALLAEPAVSSRGA